MSPGEGAPAPDTASATEPVRIVRVIARLNIGGPAIQAITLTSRMEALGYSTILVRGLEEPDEGSMDNLARRLGVQPMLVPWLRRNPGWHDARALIELVRIMRRERPRIVHTHAAKGGTLGRLAAVIAFPVRRPILVHTYHGHSLTGYFVPRVAATYRMVERVLAWVTDRLIAVSDEVRDELVEMGVAPASKFEVVPLGFDFSPFGVNGAARARLRSALRQELGIPAGARVVTLVARLVPIKRVDRFLRLAQELSDLSDVRFLVVGDGELREALRGSAEARSLGERVIWSGFRGDMPSIYFASDVVVQTSDNEGTPVALIEAQAAGVPVVSTQVGGSASVVPGERLVEPENEAALASAVRALLSDLRRAPETGKAGSGWMRNRFALSRLVDDVDRLYQALLNEGTRASDR